jgi:predicted Zn-dependent peptidase
MAQIAFRKALYGDHPYGRLFPDSDQLESYSVEQIRSFYEDNFGAQRTHLFLSGMFDVDAVRAAIEAAFGDWKTGPPVLSRPPEPAQGRRYIDIVDRANASQSNVILGLPTIDPSQPDFIALEVANAMLGGYFSSRITSNIREDKGYTYSPFSQLSVRRGDGYWAQQAAITTDDTAAALKEIYFEINRLRDTPPSKEELKATQNYMAGIFTLRNSTREGIINVLNRADLHGQDDSYLTEYVSRIYALTPEDISRVTTKHLRPEDMTLAVVGDRARIGEEMAKYIDPE